MLPESIQTCLPVYRKLAPRTLEELDLIAKREAKKEKQKKRKSSSVETVRGKKATKKAKNTKAVSEKEPDIELDDFDQEENVDQEEIDVINLMLSTAKKEAEKPEPDSLEAEEPDDLDKFGELSAQFADEMSEAVNIGKDPDDITATLERLDNIFASREREETKELKPRKRSSEKPPRRHSLAAEEEKNSQLTKIVK